MNVRVYAKINLTLSVGARNGAFHPVDGIVTSIDLFDSVEVTARRDGKILLHSDLALPCQKDSAFRAAQAFKNRFSSDGVDISVVKGIPVGAGLGGSSADAAAVVYCMCKLFGADPLSAEVRDVCAGVGSDVNFMLRGGLARMRGKGDDLVFSSLKRQLYFALTTFDVPMSTADVYSRFDRLTLGKSPAAAVEPEEWRFFARDVSDKSASVAEQLDVSAMCRNDLQAAARSLDGYAEEYLAFAREIDCKCTMTGSGSAYYVPFTSLSEAQHTARLFNDKGFVTRVCRSVPYGIEQLPR